MRARSNSASKYSGDLATPFEPDPPISLLNDQQTALEALQQKRMEEFGRKLALLLKHHGIELGAADAFERLTYALMITHVPGFQTGRPKRGKPTYWTDHRKLALEADVKIRMLKGLSEIDACRELVKLQKYQAVGGNAETRAKSLQRRMQEGRTAPFVAAIRKLILFAGDNRKAWEAAAVIAQTGPRAVN